MSNGEFSKETKRRLANSVGNYCSNPSCRASTTGPNMDDNHGYVRVGEFAHICGRRPGSARYDPDMTDEERADYDNGIYLCAKCHTLIDSQPNAYPVALLRQWKESAKEYAAHRLHYSNQVDYEAEDRDYLRFVIRCFSRPAFEEDIWYESNMDDFDQALNDTIYALNTGILKSRDGTIIQRCTMVRNLHSTKWNEQLSRVYEILCQMRRTSETLRSQGLYSELLYDSGLRHALNCFDGKERAEEKRQGIEYFNSARREMLGILSSLLKDAGYSSMPFRNRRY